MKVRRAGIAVVLVALLAGCASYGPSSMPEDRLAYTLAVARSLEEQLLLNIVRTRYGEAPTFVDVSQIVAGYEIVREGSIGGEAHINNGADSFISPGVKLSLTEKPTVTYAPLNGEGFARTLVAPVPPHLILLLLQSGWSADAVLSMSVRSINGYRNRLPRMGTSAPADPEFANIVLLIRQLQDAGAVDFSVHEEKDNKRAIFFTLRASADVTSQARVAELRKLLGVDETVGEIPISVGLLRPTDGGITLYTFSLFQMLVAQGKHVSVPEGAMKFAAPDVADIRGDQPTIAIRSGLKRPENAAAAVPYAGHWYWIDREDQESKVTLMAFTMLYRLLESGTPGNLPVLTIPAG
jgi:hypothetical protein